MDTGVKDFAKATGVNASQTGPAEASPEQQVKIISDLIAQKPAAITIVPNAPESVEGVMKQARSQGIVVVTHENSTGLNVDADIEAFDNTAYGAHIMDSLASCMNNEGSYAAFVGSVTAQSHNEWVAGALAQAKAKYPKITRVGEPVESKENADTAYQKTKELLQKYPDLKGIEGSASVDIAGIGRAVQELGLQDKVCVMGTSIPSVAGKYLADGSVDKMFFWDPALAGKAMLTMADSVVKGTPITAGMDLKIPGYESIAQSKTNPKAFYGSAWIDVDSKNAAEYPF
jgi:simple sugar transport system substrate-binding protein